ncbi:MAG TPA: hypothetical protein VMK66_20505 [Myxococcales bacterium]|nr:hypothetical protein [Myxococcales bacterium]
MRSWTSLALVAVLVTPALAEEKASPGFDQIKSLAGEWEGTAKGHGSDAPLPTQATVRVVSAGSAVMLVTAPGTPHEMVTMFHRDDQALVATHYCSAMNQPRMRAREGKDASKISFEFADGTNLGAHPAHMQTLVLTMLDADHHQEEWTFRDGTTEHKMLFDLRRKK